MGRRALRPDPHRPGSGLLDGRILLEQMFGRRPDATYRRSQSATGLPVQPSAVARGLALRIIDSTEDPQERKRLGQMLIDELDAIAGLPHCDLVVADRAQVHSHNGQRLQSKTYGYYRCTFADGAVKTARIRIYHRTAVRQQVITTKVFLNTLLHEWEHHHDFGGLRLPRSPHTAGFYARLRALAGALEVAFVMPPEPGADGTAQTSAA
jgi:hypothetical protein